MAAAGFLSCYMNGPLPCLKSESIYHITIFLNVLSVLLNISFLSFINGLILKHLVIYLHESIWD